MGAELRDRGDKQEARREAMTDDDRCAPRVILPKPYFADSQYPSGSRGAKVERNETKNPEVSVIT